MTVLKISFFILVPIGLFLFLTRKYVNPYKLSNSFSDNDKSTSASFLFKHNKSKNFIYLPISPSTDFFNSFKYEQTTKLERHLSISSKSLEKANKSSACKGEEDLG